MNSFLLTPELVARVGEILRPSIEEIIEIDPSRFVAHVVVIEPTTRPSQYIDDSVPILWQGSFGKQKQKLWPYPYDEFARRKAVLSWRTGLPSHIVRFVKPHLFEEGDFKFGGSIVFEGIIVGTSGLAWQHDLMISGMMATGCYALSIGASLAELDRKPYFIGAPDPAIEQK